MLTYEMKNMIINAQEIFWPIVQFQLRI